MKLFKYIVTSLSIATVFAAQPAEARRHYHHHASFFAHHSHHAHAAHHRSFGHHVATYAADYAIHYETRRAVRAALAPIDGREHADKPAAPAHAEPAPSPPPPNVTLARTEYSHAGPRLGVNFAPTEMRVVVVDENSPAWLAGLSPADVVKKANGVSVKTSSDFAQAINDAARTGALLLTVERDGKEYTASIPMGAPNR